jgi:hypothetical protein
MPWLIGVAFGFGILLGLWLRVPSVVAASGAVVLLCSVVTTLAGWSPLTAIALIFALLFALQCGYLVGVLSPILWFRTESKGLCKLTDQGG